ncbi:MAG: gamma-glutamyl-phosphate reductase, partial [Pontixanthobacter sp.]
MNAHSIDTVTSIATLGARAKIAARQLMGASTAAKNLALTAAAKALRDDMTVVVAANRQDVDSVRDTKPAAFI